MQFLTLFYSRFVRTMDRNVSSIIDKMEFLFEVSGKVCLRSWWEVKPRKAEQFARAV
jgi:hypothetical protein